MIYTFRLESEDALTILDAIEMAMKYAMEHSDEEKYKKFSDLEYECRKQFFENYEKENEKENME